MQAKILFAKSPSMSQKAAGAPCSSPGSATHEPPVFSSLIRG